jgi:DNA-binding beta-propeller fold protein YncE
MFSSSGTFITQWGPQWSENGQFEEPMGIAVDASGNVYVADSGNDRIEVFSP